MGIGYQNKLVIGAGIFISTGISPHQNINVSCQHTTSSATYEEGTGWAKSFENAPFIGGKRLQISATAPLFSARSTYQQFVFHVRKFVLV
jgi:hypothetical protein